MQVKRGNRSENKVVVNQKWLGSELGSWWDKRKRLDRGALKRLGPRLVSERLHLGLVVVSLTPLRSRVTTHEKTRLFTCILPS
jgi:hypothetical protein